MCLIAGAVIFSAISFQTKSDTSVSPFLEFILALLSFILCLIGNFRSIEDHFTFIGMTIPINIFYLFVYEKKIFEYGDIFKY